MINDEVNDTNEGLLCVDCETYKGILCLQRFNVCLDPNDIEF